MTISLHIRAMSRLYTTTNMFQTLVGTLPNTALVLMLGIKEAKEKRLSKQIRGKLTKGNRKMR